MSTDLLSKLNAIVKDVWLDIPFMEYYNRRFNFGYKLLLFKR